MENEVKNNQPIENENKTVSRGVWGDINLTTELPVSAVIQFLNILNQRLVDIESMLTITTEDGNKITLTEWYNLTNQEKPSEEK